MQFLRKSLREHSIYGIYTFALVFSLAVYQRLVVTDPLSVAQKHWAAIAAADPDRTVDQYGDKAILMRSHGALDEVYQGQSIYPAWKEFFSNYKIQNFQVIQQHQRHRAVEAEIKITAKAYHGPIVVLSLFYKVQFDQDGKITHEFWQVNPELSV